MPGRSTTAKVSAGLLMCRRCGSDLGSHTDTGALKPDSSAARWEFLLVHPGGPFFAKKDDGVWSVPKGLLDPGEEPLNSARREFLEETGFATPDGGYLDLGHVVQSGGKIVHAWAFVGDCAPELVKSNTFTLEWPPRSGRMREFPEVDRAGFFGPDAAKRKLIAAQAPFIDRALALLG